MQQLAQICKYLFNNLAYKAYLPNVIEYRLQLLLYNMIVFELFCMMVPHLVDINPFNIIKLQSNGFTTAYIAGCGQVRRRLIGLLKEHF